MIGSAFEALDRARLRYSFRKGSRVTEDLPPGGEVDIALDRSELRAARRALEAAGFHALGAAGCAGHRFYVAFEGHRWRKIDIKIARAGSSRAPDGAAAHDSPPWIVARLGQALAQRRPLSVHRQGPVVALLGPDGAGKGSVIARLKMEIPIALTVIYLGHRRRRPDEPERVRRLDGWTGVLLESAFVIRRALRFWRILIPGYLAAWSGHIVLCDRHPIETLAMRSRQTRMAAWLEHWLVGRLMPWPDLILVLDAPAAILYARKAEHSPDVLERLRRRYIDTFTPRGAMVISTQQPLENSVAEASEAIWEALKGRHRW